MNINLLKVPTTYATKRETYYPLGVEQLDLLWHSVDNGDFGEDAKSASFYTELKAVKDKYPKPQVMLYPYGKYFLTTTLQFGIIIIMEKI